MKEELISKKELLETAGISYGQLYRWKRKGLIPEDWFIKKSSFTGQETFFPKFKVLSRIERIKDMKEDVSLDDLADVFTPSLGAVQLEDHEIISRGLASVDVLKIYKDMSGGDSKTGFNDIVALHILDRLIVSGDISLEEARTLLQTLREASLRLGIEASEVYIMRKLGVFFCLVAKPPSQIVTDPGVKTVGRLDIAALTEEIKVKLI